MIELRWIGNRSSAAVAAVMGATFGLPLSVLLFIIEARSLAFGTALIIFIATAVLVPVIAMIAFEFGIILYDVAAKGLGGACLDIRGGELKRVDLSSYLRIALPLNLIYLLLFFAATFVLFHTGSLGTAGIGLALLPLLIVIAIGALNGIVDPVVYNYIAKAIGGAKLDIRRGVLGRIDTAAGAKIGSLLVAFNYIFYTIIIEATSFVGFRNAKLQSISVFALGPYPSFVIYVALYLVAGLIGAALVLELYNNAAVKVAGGIELNIRKVGRRP